MLKIKMIVLLGVVCAGFAGSGQKPVELLVDVDVFDNQTVAKSHYDAPFYGPREIDALFAKCSSNGVTRLTWRAQCQIATYPSKLNYNISEVPSIRSNADDRRSGGAFAAKVGVGLRVPVVLPELKKLHFGGLVQRVANDAQMSYVFSGDLSVNALPVVRLSWFRRMLISIGLRQSSHPGAFLAAIDARSGKVIERGAAINSEAFQRSEIRFACDRPFYVGAFSEGHQDIQVFVVDGLTLKDEAGRERLLNGDMETSDHLLEPADWQQSAASFVTLNGDFRTLDAERKTREFPRGDGAFKVLHRPYTETLFTRSIEAGDPLAYAGEAAQRNGVSLYAWLDPVDDGRRALPPVQSWSSRFLEEHPEFRAADREGRTRWGLLCFGYPEVRAYKTALVRELLQYEGVAGVALKMHYQHNMIWDGNVHDYSKYLYNDVALADYHKRWGRPTNGLYDTYKLRMIYGEYVLEWLREIRPLFESSGKRLCLFQAPTSMLDAMCGGWVVPPEQILEERLCDDFLIEPRHRGDSIKLVRDTERIRNLLWLCRRQSVRVGFDYWVPGIPSSVKAAERGIFMRDQLTNLAREAFDFIGVYEEMCLVKPNLWPYLGEASRIIRAAPPRTIKEPEAIQLQARNLLSLNKGGSAYVLVPGKEPMPVPQLIDGDDSQQSGITVEVWPVVVELKPSQDVRVSCVALKGGNLSWSNQCAPEDFIIEGLVDGAWRTLAEIKDAATRNKHDNTIPVECRFKPLKIAKLRITVTRSSDSGKRYLVLREIEGFLEDK